MTHTHLRMGRQGRVLEGGARPELGHEGVFQLGIRPRVAAASSKGGDHRARPPQQHLGGWRGSTHGSMQ